MRVPSGPGRCSSQAGVDTDNHRHVLAVEVADEESENSGESFLKGQKACGPTGVQNVVSDSHRGLKCAIEKVLTTALKQRCVVHFLRNAPNQNCCRQVNLPYFRQ